MNWFNSKACESRAFCRACREDAAWRQTLFASGRVPARDFECQWGVTAADLPPTVQAHGPGTELKRRLASIGIVADPRCKCNAMARRMDAGGPEWVREHVEEIVRVMREEAHRRELPFSDRGARLLIRFAVWRSERANAHQSASS